MKILLWIVLSFFYLRTIGDLFHQIERHSDKIEDNPAIVFGLIIGFLIDVTAAVLATTFVMRM